MRGNTGFSLIEIIVSLACVSVLLGAGIVVSIETLTRTTLAQERDLLVSLLSLQRAQALSNRHGAPYGINVTSNTIEMFEGSVVSKSPTTSSVPRNGHIHVTGDTQMQFAPQSGDSLAGIRTLILSQNSSAATITVNERGRIDW